MGGIRLERILSQRRRIVWCLLPLLLTSAACLAAGKTPAQPPNKSPAAKPAASATETVRLAMGQKALLPIVVGPKASVRVKAAADTLAEYLGKMSGATFTVKTGDGAAGIVVGLPADFSKLPRKVAFPTGPYHREDYVLFSRTTGAWLIGATDLAVEHAVWDFLARFGYRQYFPTKIWEIVPTLDTLAIAVNANESPDYAHRRIWYNWGYLDYNTQTYADWCKRNRMAQGFQLNSGHAYGSMVRANKAVFNEHPEYYALLEGKRVADDESKMCLSNTDLRQLIVKWAVDQVKANPQIDSISVDPSDGGGWCECEDCAKMGIISNRALTLANEVAEAINQLGLGDKYVGMYAYSFHSAPPTIKVHPKVIITATTAFITGGFTLDQVIEGWQAQGATIGIYDYYSVTAWDWSLPGRAWASRARDLAPAIRRFYRKGARFYDCEAGDCWGPCGLGYYIASRAMWDITIADRVDAVIEDFLTRAFGPAKEPMRKFYDLISSDVSQRSGSDLTGRMYRCLAEAKRLAAGRRDVLTRIYSLVAYTRYVELSYIGSGPKADKDSGNRTLTHAYRMRKLSMIHYYGIWSRTVGQGAALDPNHPLKDETPFSQQELEKMLSDGIANNQPEEMGFTPVKFSKNLVPAERLQLPDVPLGSVPNSSQENQFYYIWIDQAPSELHLQVKVQLRWNLWPHHVKLFAVKEDGTEALIEDNTSVKPDGKIYDVILHPQKAGLHRIHIIDGGDTTYVTWPEGMRFVIPSGDNVPQFEHQFRGSWSLYCYVPKGAKVVGGWFQGRAGALLDSDGKVMIEFAKKEDGWFSAPVAPGQDGKLWKFENCQGRRQLMTVPPYLARNGSELLLPKEVVEKDAKAPK